MDVQHDFTTGEHLKRHERELEVLASVSALLASQSGQQEMLTQVLHELEQQLGMRHSTVMLLSADGSELIVEATRGAWSQDWQALRYRRGEGVIGEVVQTGQTAIVPRISQEPMFTNRIYQRPEGGAREAGFICVPIELGSEVVGTLSADLPPQPIELLHEQARVLRIVASLIAFDVKSRRMAQLERADLEAQNIQLRSKLGEQFRPENIIGNSHAMRAVYQRIHQVAVTSTTVLIRGESGTGKELVASAIHYGSSRSNRPFVKVNCAALSEALLESELFGHERGAFTGAIQSRAGRIEEAEGGTLFLDEIGDFSPAIQVKLLRVLQEREFERVGSNKTVRADLRIIAATNRDLEAAVEAGTFRQDLYYRINVVPVYLPPLRERKHDILLLADHFVERYSQKMEKNVRRISTTAINMMFAYHWPGNVRELENCIEHAVLLSADDVIHSHNLPPTLQMPDGSNCSPAGSLSAHIALLERDRIVDALKSSQGNITAAARQLGITARMVRYKIKKLGIDRQRFLPKPR
jgi:Nif-specific regulatory protein